MSEQDETMTEDEQTAWVRARSAYCAMAFGAYFSMVHGWTTDLTKVTPVSRAAAAVIVEENPGAVVVEVQA